MAAAAAGDSTPFGAALRRHRLAAGLSHDALAERAGLSARAISDLERGVSRAPRPATLVRWGYQQAGPLGMNSSAAVGQPPLPPVTGTDELVLQGGRIARYTRRPDPASVAARRQALNAAAADRPAPPDTQARRTPKSGPWLVALGLSLAGVVLLALLKRPPETP